MKDKRNIILAILFLSIVAIFSVFIFRSQGNQEGGIEQIFISKDDQEGNNVREPAVSGSFYSENPEQLSSQISSFIENIEKVNADGKYRILILPHAGLDYSGQTAAWGFGQINPDDYKRVIIIGSSHNSFFDHVAIYDKGAWKTPLGEIDVDEEFAELLLDKNQNIVSDKNAHALEHSLEMELIFLQEVLDDFKIVPILVSKQSEELVSNLARKIAISFDEETLLVISTDLSHYPTWEVANEVDNYVIDAILKADKNHFEKVISDIEASNYDNLETPVCGYESIRVGLKVSEFLNLDDFVKLYYENSGDVTGDRGRVVGYPAIGVVSKSIVYKNPELNVKAQEEALRLARETLIQYLTFNKKPVFSFNESIMYEPLGVFVTLEKDGELRGCIGHFEPNQPLYEVIQEMVVKAATEDIRFTPMTSNELDDIEIEISIMTPKTKIDNWKEIELGTHGVVIQSGNKSGTFLPQVGEEQDWILEKFLAELCTQKLGLSSKCYLDPDVSIYTYEAQVFKEE